MVPGERASARLAAPTLHRAREQDTKDLEICYDTGHGHLQGTTSGFENIRTTHIHDNNGENDEHLWPFEGTLNWPALIEKLVVAKYKGPFVFEARGEDLSKGDDVRNRL